MKLHLPIFLRKAVLACTSAGVVFYCTVASASLVMADESVGSDAEVPAAEPSVDTEDLLSGNTLSEVVYSGTNQEGIDLTSAAGCSLIIFALDDADNNSISKNYFAGNATVVTSAPVQIGATGGDGSTGLVITDGNSGNHQIFTGTLTGNGIIKKVGAGTNNAFSFTGDTTGLSGNIYLKPNSERAFTLTFGTVTSGGQTYTGVAGSTSAESGIIGNGKVTFIGSNENHKLVFNYDVTDPVYITNIFDFTGTTDGYIELNGSADYIITQDISDITRFKKNTTGSVRADGKATFNVASGSVSTADTHILAGGTLTKTGAGELKIAHELNYGNIVIKEGTLFWQSDTADYGTARINAEQLTIESGAVFKISQNAGDHSQLDIVTKGGELFVHDLRGSVTFGTLDMQADASLRYTYNTLVNYTGVTGTGNLTIDVSSDANDDSKITNLGHLNDYTGTIGISETALSKGHAAQLGVDRVTLSEGKTLTLGYAITSADFVKNGAGELRLNGVALNAQSATVTGGSFTLTDGATLASSTVTVQDGAVLQFDTQDGSSVSLSGALSGAGTLLKTGAGSATVGSVADSFAGTIALQGGSLNLGASFLLGEDHELSIGMYDAVLESALTLGAGKLSVYASGSGAATSLNNTALTLLGGTQLQLSGGNGGVYDLLSGVSSLLGADGSAFELTAENNAISNYFDTTLPGTGFWKDATLVLNNGILQLVRHNETVKDAVTYSNYTSSANGGAFCGTFTFSDSYYSYGEHRLVVDVTLQASLSLSNIGNIQYCENEAANGDGGAIYGETISLSGNGNVLFRGNKASGSGGAISIFNFTESDYQAELDRRYPYEEPLGKDEMPLPPMLGNLPADVDGSIALNNNGSVTFIGNTADTSYAYGGAIYGAYDSTITLNDNGSVVFSENSAGRGGSIAYHSACLVTLSNNGSVEFSGNTASYGGAIYGGHGSTLALNNNGSLEFNGNTAASTSAAFGGAIYGDSSTIELNNNGSVKFSGNTASSTSAAFGGAIYGDNGSTIELNNNGSVKFSGNTASSTSDAFGGAIFVAHGGTIALNNNGSLEFNGNTADNPSAFGGAIYGAYDSTITLSDNGSVTFSGNKAAYGGAIAYHGGLQLSDNDSLEFSGNSAFGSGGAIGAYDGILLINRNGCVTFIGNTADTSYAYGGAIYGAYDSTITLSDNGSVTFSGNKAAYGGAIYASGNLSIQNNDYVLFEKNAEITNGSYRLRNIYAGGSGDVISLSAAKGKSIEFRDSIYIASGTTVNLNAAYTDAAGVVHEQQGDILFTGATTVDDLYEAKGSVAGTEEEIRLSRTTEVNALTNLYGGRLRVEDGAIYQGRGITALEGSGSTVRVKDATLSHSGYDLTFTAGTTLELEGANSITGNVKMLEGSTLRLTFDDSTASSAELQLSDTLTLKAGSQVQRAGADGKVALLGDGTLRMESSADFLSFSLGNTWTGTVSLADITAEADLKMSTIGRAGSTIELENVKGYTGVKNGTVAANLVLTQSTAANGTEQASFLVSDGYSSTTKDYVMTTFSGKVSGAGKIVFDKTLSSPYTGFEFIGNVKDWTGAFEMKAGNTFNLVFGGKATEIKADIRDGSTDSTLNLVLGADAAMTLSGSIDTDSITVSNAVGASFSNTVSTGTLSAASCAVSFGAAATVSGDMNAAAVVLNQGGSLDVGGSLSAGQVTLKELSTTAPTLTVGSFAAGDTIFTLDVDTLNALNLGHGQSVVIARADSAIGSDFSAWLAEGSTTLNDVVYRYELSVSGADVMVSLDYANWGTRIWYDNAWVGKESWKEYMTAGHDAVNDIETVDLGGADIVADGLYIAPDSSSVMTVLSNGTITAEYTEVANGKLTIAEGVVLETSELAADGREILLQGKLVVSSDGSIGLLSGTEGTLELDGTLSVDSDVTLGSLVNGGSLGMSSHKLNVAGACIYAGNVTAGEVVMHNRTINYVEFDTLVADKVTVTNTSSSASYTDNISVGDGSSIGELVAEKLQVRGGSATLGRADSATEQTLLNLELQNDATLVLNQQTALSVTDSISATADAAVQLKQDAALNYGVLSISNRGTAETAELKLAGLVDGTASIRNAHVAVNSSEALSVGYQLDNSSLENAGSGKLTVTAADSGMRALYATGGDLELFYQRAALSLQELVLNDNTTVAVYTGFEVEKEQQSAISVAGMVGFGDNTQVNASLTINNGAELKMSSSVQMTGSLSLDTNLTLSGEILTTLQTSEIGSTVTLFTGIESLQLLGNVFHALTQSDAMESSIFFSNLQDSDERYYYMVYDSTVPGAGVLSIGISEFSIPEPTSSTLSLFALTALCARRRRK